MSILYRWEYRSFHFFGISRISKFIDWYLVCNGLHKMEIKLSYCWFWHLNIFKRILKREYLTQIWKLFSGFLQSYLVPVSFPITSDGLRLVHWSLTLIWWFLFQGYHLMYWTHLSVNQVETLNSRSFIKIWMDQLTTVAGIFYAHCKIFRNIFSDKLFYEIHV